MKKIAKLLTLLLAVATVVTGIVFAVSADDSAPEFVYQPAPNTDGNYTYSSEALLFTGKYGSNDWWTDFVANPSKAPEVDLTNQGKGEGDKLNSIWASFDLLNDADIRLSGNFRLCPGGNRSNYVNIMNVPSAVNYQLQTPGGEVMFDFEGKPYGWYHIDLSITSSGYTIDGGTVTYGDYTVTLYVNGESVSSYTLADSDLAAKGNRPYTVAADGTVTPGDVAFYYASGSKLLRKTPDGKKNFLWFSNIVGGVGYMDPTKKVDVTYDLAEGEMPVWSIDATTFKQADFPSPYDAVKGPYLDFAGGFGAGASRTYTPNAFTYDLHKYTYTYAGLGASTVLPIPEKAGSTFAGWTVEGNPATATVSEAGGVWTLNVAANHTGDINLVASWAAAANGDVKYEAEGATLGGEYPTTFPLAAPSTITLPTEVTLAGCRFLGWYTDASFSGDPITSYTTTADDIAAGSVTFYARFATYIELGFDEAKTVTESDAAAFGANVGTSIGENAGATFEAKDGLLYFTKTGATSGSASSYQVSLRPTFLAPKSDALTFSFDVMKNGDEDIVQTDFRLRTSAAQNGNTFITITSDGVIHAGSSTGTAVGTLTDALQTVTVVVHFTSDTTCVYEIYVNGSPKYESASTKLSSVKKSTIGMLFCYFDQKSTGSIVLDDICIYDGEVLKGTYYNASFVANGEQVSVKKTANDIALPSSYAYWIGEDGKIYAAGDVVTLTKDATFTALTVDLLTGASVRMNTPSGLRFETAINEAMMDLLKLNDGMTFSIGTIIVPTDKLGSTSFTKADLAAAGIAYAGMTTGLNGVAAEDGVYTFYASLTNILAQNYTRKFSAISYIQVKIGDNTYIAYDKYVEADNARSVYDVAYRLLTETEPADDTVLKSFADKVVVLDASLAVCNTVADKYESPYTATYADGTLTVSRVDGEAITVENLSTVVIDGVSYTGGWRFVDGDLVAPYTLAE